MRITREARGRVSGDGIELAFGYWPGRGAPVVALHGLTASYVNFIGIAERLAGRLPLLGFDLRGRGDSDKPEGPYGMVQHARDVAAAMRTLGLASSIVVGHSMGAFVAAALAAQDPELVSGLVLIAGGKYTSYRIMGRDAVDAVAHGLDGKVAPSCTDVVPLAGADGYIALWNSRYTLARSSGLHVARIEHLLHRYGSMISEVLALIAADPSLGKPLTGADEYLRAEIVYAASHEGARHLDDALARRTHASIETWDRGLSAAEEAATLMAGPMKWKSRQIARELENYRLRVAAERASQEADTDQDADAIRLGAPDIVPVVHGDTVPA